MKPREPCSRNSAQDICTGSLLVPYLQLKPEGKLDNSKCRQVVLAGGLPTREGGVRGRCWVPLLAPLLSEERTG